jgi:hypothetical protein
MIVALKIITFVLINRIEFLKFTYFLFVAYILTNSIIYMIIMLIFFHNSFRNKFLKIGFVIFQANLYTLVKMRPSVLHLGHKGEMLLARFLSIPKGFRFLQDANYITQELEKWHQVSNLKCPCSAV